MYAIESRVRFSEIGEDGYLTIPAIVNYFQDCSTFQSEELGRGAEFLKNHKRVWILNAWQIMICRRPQLMEQIKISTWSTGFDGLYGTRNFKMETKEGEMLACANSIWVYMDVEKGRPVKASKEEISVYASETPLEMDYAPRKIALPKDGRVLEGFYVKKNQLDTNHHMNNGQYVKAALEYVPDTFSIRQIRVEYKKSAMYGDYVVPKMTEEGNKITIGLCSEEGKTYAALEMIGE